MSMILHPGASPSCAFCKGGGLEVKPVDELARAVPCRCLIVCPRCRGSGFAADPAGGRVQNRARCACSVIATRAGRFDAGRIPARYAHCTLSSFDLTSEAQVRVLGAVHGWYKARANLGDPEAIRRQRGVVLWGDVGRGKTHLLIALLRELALGEGATVRFVEFSHLIADLKSGFDRGDGGGDIVDPLVKVDVLAIDELGKGRATEWELTIVDELVSRRYNALRTVLATTNYEPTASTGVEAPNLAAPERRPGLVDRVGDRVYSRLREMCDFVPVGGEDHRVATPARPRKPRAPRDSR